MNTQISTLKQAIRVYEVIEQGGLALLLTQTGYGLVAMRAEAVKRIYELKGRPAAKPCVTVGTMSILDDLIEPLEPHLRGFVRDTTAAFPLALVAKLREESGLIASFDSYVRGQCTKGDTIATFFGVGPVLTQVANVAQLGGQLVVGSSANLAGTGNNYRLEDVPETMRRAADLVIDGGVARYVSEERLASTILDLTTQSFLRRGAAFEPILAAYHNYLSHLPQPPGVPTSPPTNTLPAAS